MAAAAAALQAGERAESAVADEAKAKAEAAATRDAEKASFEAARRAREDREVARKAAMRERARHLLEDEQPEPWEVMSQGMAKKAGAARKAAEAEKARREAAAKEQQRLAEQDRASRAMAEREMRLLAEARAAQRAEAVREEEARADAEQAARKVAAAQRAHERREREERGRREERQLAAAKERARRVGRASEDGRGVDEEEEEGGGAEAGGGGVEDCSGAQGRKAAAARAETNDAAALETLLEAVVAHGGEVGALRGWRATTIARGDKYYYDARGERFRSRAQVMRRLGLPAAAPGPSASAAVVAGKRGGGEGAGGEAPRSKRARAEAVEEQWSGEEGEEEASSASDDEEDNEEELEDEGDEKATVAVEEEECGSSAVAVEADSGEAARGMQAQAQKQQPKQKQEPKGADAAGSAGGVGLPSGWREVQHQTERRRWKSYIGPDGQHAQSRAEVLRRHMASGSAEGGCVAAAKLHPADSSGDEASRATGGAAASAGAADSSDDNDGEDEDDELKGEGQREGHGMADPLLHARIEVYWSGYRRWFAGTVVAVALEGRQRRQKAYEVHYEIDGAREWHRLHGTGKIVVRWRHTPADAAAGGDRGGGSGAAGDRSGAGVGGDGGGGGDGRSRRSGGGGGGGGGGHGGGCVASGEALVGNQARVWRTADEGGSRDGTVERFVDGRRQTEVGGNEEGADDHNAAAAVGATAEEVGEGARGAWEVACCDLDYSGEWRGEWEACTLLATRGKTCDVRVASDGALCKGVPCHLVRSAQPRAEPKGEG